MKNSFFATLAAGAVLLGASVASADTIVFDPAGDGIDVISQSGFENNLSVDVNQDGVNDVNFGIRDFGFGGAFIRSISDVPEAPGPVLDLPQPQGPVLDEPFFPFGNFTSFYQRVLLSDVLYEEGDVIGPDDFTANTLDFLYGRRTTSAENYLPNVGDSAIFGIQIEMGEALFQNFDGVRFLNFTGETQTFFAFIEVSHGSIQIGQAGYNTVSGQSVVAGGLAPVPLPAGVVLLLGALGGLGALRLRRRA